MFAGGACFNLPSESSKKYYGSLVHERGWRLWQRMAGRLDRPLKRDLEATDEHG